MPVLPFDVMLLISFSLAYSAVYILQQLLGPNVLRNCKTFNLGLVDRTLKGTYFLYVFEQLYLGKCL